MKSVKSSITYIMKYNPTIHSTNSESAITSKPKIMAISANTDFDTVKPIFLSPFSTVSVMFTVREIGMLPFRFEF